jgi:uroporphyrinogen decarboxylase
MMIFNLKETGETFMLSSKERVMMAMERQVPDRVPVYPVFTAYHGAQVAGIPYSEVTKNPHLMNEIIWKVGLEYGFDGLTLYAEPPNDWNANLELVTQNGENFYRNIKTGELVTRIPHDDIPVAVNPEPLVKDESDLEKLRIAPASEYFDKGRMESIKEAVKKFGDRVFITGHCAAQTMNYLTDVRGSQQGMLDLYEYPEMAAKIMDIGSDISIELGKAYIEAGVHGIYIGDAWSSCSIISPTQFREFCLPRYKRVVETFHAYGVKVYLHICGNSSPLFEMMAETGVDAIEPLDPLGGVKVEDAKKRVGDRLCLMGGVNTLTLLDGTPEEVYAEAKMCLEAGMPGGGYMLGSGDDIPQKSPKANVEALVRAAHELGNY